MRAFSPFAIDVIKTTVLIASRRQDVKNVGMDCVKGVERNVIVDHPFVRIVLLLVIAAIRLPAIHATQDIVNAGVQAAQSSAARIVMMGRITLSANAEIADLSVVLIAELLIAKKMGWMDATGVLSC